MKRITMKTLIKISILPRVSGQPKKDIKISPKEKKGTYYELRLLELQIREVLSN